MPFPAACHLFGKMVTFHFTPLSATLSRATVNQIRVPACTYVYVPMFMASLSRRFHPPALQVSFVFFPADLSARYSTAHAKPPKRRWLETRAYMVRWRLVNEPRARKMRRSQDRNKDFRLVVCTVYRREGTTESGRGQSDAGGSRSAPRGPVPAAGSWLVLVAPNLQSYVKGSVFMVLPH